MNKTIKERTLEFIKYKGISMKEFELKCNLSTGYVTSMRKGFGSEKLNNVLTSYPELNRDWLLYGEGEMLKETAPINSGSSISQNDIKEGDYSGTLVYDIDATCGTNQRDIFFTQDNIIGSVNLPGINKGSQIVRANGDSMEPRIFDGNMVVIREIHSWEDIFYGQMYLILLDEYRMIKYIRRYEPDEENYIILRSENSKYDDIKLHKGKIRKMFIVENILSVKTQL